MKIQKSKSNTAVVVMLPLVAGFIFWNIFTKESSESLARNKYAQLAIDQLNVEIGKFRQQHGRYPNESGWFVELKDSKPNSVFLGKIPLKNDEPLDPWGAPYRYTNPGIHNTEAYDLWTYGADYSPNGEGENKDITNWN
ncbi:MAG: type II secretion system protein GspG [Gammaproteobacteria bacterium]|nr:type II secretion system protein GspG [Gammaproteobacteria bacterium]